MEQSTATRRLVKSPPELWAELSTEDSLGRHLAEFGEIRITRIDPETTVAWEGDRVSGTVELAPTGWGTKVVLTATPAAELAEREAAPPTEPAVAHVAPPEPAAVVPEPAAAVPEPAAVVPEPAAAVPEPAAAVPEPAAAPPEPAAAPPEPAAAPPEPAAEPVKKRGFFARIFGRRDKGPKAATASPPAPAPATKAAIPGPPAPAPDPSPPAPTPAPSPLPPAPDPSPPTPTPQPGPPPQIRAVPDAERRTAILTDVLATLGSDHHRPYSRERD